MTPPGAGVVVVGGGQAGHSVVASLRGSGYDGPVILFADEPHLPYRRPPLSKQAHTEPDAVGAELVPESYYRERDVELRLGERVTALDTVARAAATSTGARVPYDHLVLATGARNRRLPVPGAELAGVHALRSLDDAVTIGRALTTARDVVVVGGGFIGLELAHVALAQGARVTVVEMADRLLGRALSPQLERHLRERHERAGVRVLTGTAVRAVAGDGRAQRVVTSAGVLPTDLVVYGIGAVPNDELARGAGLAVDDGVLVDEWLRSVTDPRISAVGDCARHPHPRADGLVRLESVQNATDQGTSVGRRIAGAPPAPYRSLPWFWSDQGAVRLQIAGLRTDTDEVRVVPGDAADRLAAYAFRDDRLVAVETLNWPAEHLAARRLLDRPAPVRAADLEGSTLGALARAGRTAEARA
ncbi:FAD-dependent oxidoreductase [Streptomyces caniscabiei]|uniref:FAD-dependent oxidoreductase n=1 Tax=Streptomyces caniscabiei TaxID=2746961 RepID=A0A927LAC4_9ACTN|nr:FAD-dependent oxidoreductase [Streptomyces caniscabiei]MBD9725393.1 FAD-dependent oxidoreductase [Streptomyces caniscabiei]MDX3510946.1 FAD-dependent oxidoreductase [Streptomyces caniscabiei]MDX3720110.1 FAD-dependent oxidoreductase [Streptomyces caniscabiei]WEO29222.1 FAD-dependent oxidoreductase [Streptomyces caniscabiei]